MKNNGDQIFAGKLQHNHSKVSPYFQVTMTMCEPTVVYLQMQHM